MLVNYNSDSVYKILNRYFCTFLNDRTPYIHIEEKDGKFSINAVSLPETKKISALMKQARILEIMAEKLYEQASNSTCSSPSLSPSATLCNSGSGIRTLKQKNDSITIQDLFIPQTQEDIDNYIEKKTLKYFHKEKLLAQATLLWGYTHGYMKNETSQATVEASEEFQIFSEIEMKPLKEKIALGGITFERVEVLLNQPRPILSALANDICRQMSFTIFNPSQMNIKQGFKPKNESPQAIRIATIEHFEYLLVCFATHFFPKKREIYLTI
ncbi:MAG: hypothetical protein H0U49_01925 [Parachlamydiaceae bacterium]|nr:hypothetical protein [Parachlamydiaceae bacterium]